MKTGELTIGEMKEWGGSYGTTQTSASGGFIEGGILNTEGIRNEEDSKVLLDLSDFLSKFGVKASK
jgi:hypothetical protein